MGASRDARWVRFLHADGVTAYVQDLGLDAGRIRVTFAKRPWVSLSTAAVAAVAQSRAASATATITNLEEVITTEGEFAGVATLSGITQGISYERVIGLVYADYSYAMVEAVYNVDHRDVMHDMTRRLIKDYPLRLGGQRRRRFRFSAPPDWFVHERDLNVHFYPPEFPRKRAALSVLAAEPSNANPATQEISRFLFEDLYAGFEIKFSSQHKVFSEYGLAGDFAAGTGVRPGETEPTHVLQVVMQDESHIYRCRLETQDESHRNVFLNTVRSMRPLPRAELVGSKDTFTWLVD